MQECWALTSLPTLRRVCRCIPSWERWCRKPRPGNEGCTALNELLREGHTQQNTGQLPHFLQLGLQIQGSHWCKAQLRSSLAQKTGGFGIPKGIISFASAHGLQCAEGAHLLGHHRCFREAVQTHNKHGNSPFLWLVQRPGTYEVEITSI